MMRRGQVQQSPRGLRQQLMALFQIQARQIHQNHVSILSPVHASACLRYLARESLEGITSLSMQSSLFHPFTLSLRLLPPFQTIRALDILSHTTPLLIPFPLLLSTPPLSPILSLYQTSTRHSSNADRGPPSSYHTTSPASRSVSPFSGN